MTDEKQCPKCGCSQGSQSKCGCSCHQKPATTESSIPPDAEEGKPD